MINSEIWLYFDESKVLQYFINMRHNLATPDIFAVVVKVMNNIGLWGADLTWYSSSATFRIFLVEFAFIAWSTASESTLLDLPDPTWSSRFLPSALNSFNHLITILWSTAHSPFAQWMFLVVSAALWPGSNSKSMSSRIRLCCTIICVAFKLTHRMEQCTTCQRTNYHGTTNRNGYLSRLELFRSCDICDIN